MEIRHIIICIILIIMPYSVQAEEKTPCDKNPNPIVDECFTVHGRISFYVGTPSFRMWIVGTKRLLGINDWWADKRIEMLPENVRDVLPPDYDITETAIFGDYEVCPLAPERAGWMRSICIKSATNLVSVQLSSVR